MLVAVVVYALVALCTEPVADSGIGTRTAIWRFPYQISVETVPQRRKEHVCGAAIISEDWAITAAHCFKVECGKLVLRVGSHFKYKGGEVHNITSVISHAEYDFPHNDIALLKVSPPFRFSINVQPIGLLTYEMPISTEAYQAGWATDKRAQLKNISLPLVDTIDCAKYYKEGVVVVGQHICAGTFKKRNRPIKDTCGSPLVANGKLAGISSYGGGEPKVYTNVYSFVDWIKKQTGL